MADETAELRAEIQRLEREMEDLRTHANDRDATAQALSESEQRLAQLVRQCPLAVIEWSRDFRVVEWNAAAEFIFGYSRSQAMGEHGSFVVPESVLPLTSRIWRDLLAHEGGTRSRNDNVTAEGRTITCEWYNTQRIDSDGRVIGVISLAQDVTERVRAEEERRKLEHQMQESAKLESLGVLAGGIAHDFNNLLVGILGSAGLAQLEMENDSELRPHLELIERSAERAAELTRQMLAYSGKGRFVVEPVELTDLVREMAPLLQASISRDVCFRYGPARRETLLEGDGTQIRQVVMNLILNAADAAALSGGDVDVRTGVMQADREFLVETWLHDDLPPGRYVYVEVEDNGPGMDPTTLSRIFDPFFTTKETGHGLGLAAVLGIVRGHHGFIHVETTEGTGTTFRVGFPCAVEPPHPSAPASPGGAVAIEGGTVLIVDDEATVRTVTRAVLERAGFDVLLARDGREGLDLFETEQDRISVTLLDLTMPNMTGDEAFRRIRAISPDAPVILMSGYDEQDVTRRFDGDGPSGFLQKPFRPADVVDALQAVWRR